MGNISEGVSYERVVAHYSQVQRILERLAFLRSKESVDLVLHEHLNDILIHYRGLFYPFLHGADTSELPTTGTTIPSCMCDLLDGFDSCEAALEALYREREPFWESDAGH